MPEDVSRREALGLIGGASFLAGWLLRSEEETVLGPVGGERTVSLTSQLGEWPAYITNDYSSIEITSTPAVVLHLDLGVSVFVGDTALPATTTIPDLNMELNIANSIEEAEIDRYPTLVIESPSDGSVGNVMLFEQGGA